MSAPVATLQLAAAPALCWPDGRRVALAPRDALLLTWLAIEGPTPRSRLALLLWPLADAAAARNVLRQRLFQLRRQLGLAVVEGQAILTLAAGIGHDLAAADDVLAGLDPGTGGELDGWLAQQRHDRRARMRQALAELADMAEAARDWDGARLHVREMLALDALSEDAHRRLIRLHYLAGDRAAALRAFDDCEQVLKHELGARPSPETQDRLRASSRCSVIDLPPLDIGAVTALLADVDLPGLATPEQAHSLWRHTGGNPLFLLETLKLARAGHQVPGAPWPQAGSLLRHIQQRLDRLDPLARKLVRCAAVAGQDFDPAPAATVLGLHPLDLADAWAALEAAHVLREGSFAHDLIAEAALAWVPAALAPPLHAEIAQALEARGGVPARVADHWLAAGLPARAVPALLAAGRHALAAWQPQEAARRFEQAASLQEAAGQPAAAFERCCGPVRCCPSTASTRD